MNFKHTILLFLLFTSYTSMAQADHGNEMVDPTGLYKLINKTKIKNGDTYGYFGDIKVKLIADDSISVHFYICKGAPSYNSGGFIKVLLFQNNEATFTTVVDATCSINFKFTNDGVQVLEKTADYNSGCGFGHAVVADGFYKKTSAKILEIKSATEEE